MPKREAATFISDPVMPVVVTKRFERAVDALLDHCEALRHLHSKAKSFWRGACKTLATRRRCSPSGSRPAKKGRVARSSKSSGRRGSDCDKARPAPPVATVRYSHGAA